MGRAPEVNGGPLLALEGDHDKMIMLFDILYIHRMAFVSNNKAYS